MGIVVTLADFTPPARADNVSYTSVKIEEAAAAAGPWTIVETKALAADTDPEHPAERDLTTNHATLKEGWYRVTWVSGADETAPSEPVQNLSQLSGGLRPTLADVAAKIRARTKVKGGNEVGTFTQATRPTDDEVEDLIDEALNDVLGKIKLPTVGSPYEKRARGAVALYTAMLVELSFFPEQVGTPKSPYDALSTLYDKRMQALIAEGETGEPQGEGGATDTPANAAWTFPDGELLGYGTRWRSDDPWGYARDWRRR